MKLQFKSMICLGVGLLLTACAAPPLQEGTGEVSEEGLHRLSGTNFDEVWVRPGVDVTRFQALALEETNVHYRDVEDDPGLLSPRLRSSQSAFAIPERERDRIEERFHTRLAQALDDSPHFRHVLEPQPGAVSVRASLVDFVSRVPPEGELGRTQVYVNSVGEATLVLELWDSERNELLVRAIDHQRAGPHAPQLIRGNHVTSASELSRTMQRWGDNVRDLLDELYNLRS
jgi:hypothetical protein